MTEIQFLPSFPNRSRSKAFMTWIAAICAISTLGATKAFSAPTRTAPTSLSSKDFLTYDELAAYVDSKGIVNLDDLVKELPQMMSSNPLMVYESRALNLNRVTPKTPRLIFFNKDASLILSMTANPGTTEIQKGTDTLEVIRFDDKSGKFEFRNVAFDGKPKPFRRNTEVNPAVCLACHGQNPRPIFEDYNAWPGFYGSFSQMGYAVAGTPEAENFEDFLSNYSRLPRYRDLDLSGVFTDSKGTRFQSNGFGGLYDDWQFTPSLAFGASVEFLMWRRLARKLETIPDAKQYMNLIVAIGTGDECSDHRTVVKDLYSKWANTAAEKDRGEKIGRAIQRQTRIETAEKMGRFSVHNSVDTSMDPRGFLNLPFSVYYPSTPQERTRVDSVYFDNQFVIFEALAEKLGITSEDLSTVRDAKVAGVFHIRKLNLLPDEQLFEGIVDGFAKNKSDLVDDALALSCRDRFSEAAAELATLKVPNPTSGGVFY